MASVPLLSAAQWRRIEPDLPPKRRDRRVISALLYRYSSGQSLREVSAAFDVSRARLSEWEAVLQAILPKLMKQLGLDSAGWLTWRGGGQTWLRRSDRHADVTALRLQNFSRALRRRG
jgi:transposase